MSHTKSELLPHWRFRTPELALESLEKDIMDLTSGRLYWPTQTTPHVYETLQTSITCDVAILGGGITGALVAHYLTEAGIEAVVLEKRTIRMGSTSASTALLQYEIDTTS